MHEAHANVNKSFGHFRGRGRKQTRGFQKDGNRLAQVIDITLEKRIVT